jgi:hypothetical protein
MRFFILCALFVFCAANAVKVAKFPLQVSFNLTITAHQIDEENEYPPRTRHMSVLYDYINSRGRIDIDSGYEAEKVYLRRYDKKAEFMLRMMPLSDCKRSYLGEIMPYPVIPATEYIHSNDVIRGKRVDYYLHTDFETRIHMYFEYDTNKPIQVLQESVIDDDGVNSGTSMPMLTYDYTDVTIGEPAEESFEVMKPFVAEQCDRHVGGFPYTHIFHYFVKF